MGVRQSAADIAGAVLRGVDMFDCVLPTRSGRNGQAFTREGALNLRNARFADDEEPLDKECDARLYELLARLPPITSSRRARSSPHADHWHNLTHYQELMSGLRAPSRLHSARSGRQSSDERWAVDQVYGVGRGVDRWRSAPYGPRPFETSP